jgi:predicted PurR-regulated permease PerM
MQQEDPDQRVFQRRVLTVIGLGTVVIVLLLTSWVTVNILLLVFLSALFAIIFRSFMRVITHNTKIGENIAFLIVLGGLILIVGLIVAWLGPQLSTQFEQLSDQLPQSIERVRESLSQSRWGQFLLDQAPSSSELNDIVLGGGNQADLVGQVTGFFSRTLAAITNAFVVIFLSLFLAVEPDIYTESFVRLFPKSRRQRTREVLEAIAKILQQWLLARFVSMTFVGIATTIGLYLLGTPLALALGLIAGLLSFIPTFGPLISVVPAALLAFLQSPEQALYVCGLYILVQQIDNYLVTPYIERRTVLLPPALTIVTQLLLGVLVGFLGLVLAAPLAATGVVLIRMLYIEDVLDDPVE